MCWYFEMLMCCYIYIYIYILRCWYFEILRFKNVEILDYFVSFWTKWLLDNNIRPPGTPASENWGFQKIGGSLNSSYRCNKGLEHKISGTTGSTHKVKISNWSWSCIFLEKIKIFVEKMIFDHFLWLGSRKNRFFKDLWKIMIFDPKPWLEA